MLDLGSGSGRDTYILAQLVGSAGDVVGVDMTDEQLATANGHLAWQQERFGYAPSNVRFLKGYIEKLDELDLAPESFDVIVSNCVINLSVDKQAVFRGAFRLLKPGGELYFSDVYCDRRLPDYVRADPVLYGECLGGALYWNDFLPIAKEAGFLDPRLVTSKPIGITNEAVKQKLGLAKFFSATYRVFKLDGLETACEDYGQAVVYKGSCPRYDRKLRTHWVMTTVPMSVPDGSGISSPRSAMSSMHSSTASLMFARASSTVSPWLWHPGSDGRDKRSPPFHPALG